MQVLSEQLMQHINESAAWPERRPSAGVVDAQRQQHDDAEIEAFERQRRETGTVQAAHAASEQDDDYPAKLSPAGLFWLGYMVLVVWSAVALMAGWLP